ncbi:MAG TPA: thiamine pyrophosphate-dependent dehydrogenase E1 component subunit alpha [Blastocatellia bacterium]|jgi:pyruvate dehydrogenase E1 component alpha subunit/2-oxoisovalerate dehydrogenase E1 component alpha subunit|nr:thiamine pyrophosphate-dependent dehydrogenase E1 component subunit alpha [Blastocatellia bacterium]
MELNKARKLDLLYFMWLTRSLEERLENLLKQGKIKGGLFRSLGQEGTAVGSAYALDKGHNDIVSPLTRDLGAMLVMGALPREVFASYLARGSAPTRGRDQNIHFTDLRRGFIGTVSPLGTLVAVMNGVVLATRMQGKKTVGMVYIGDGATSTGAFHEAANFAAVQNLPLVIVGENNGYAYTTPTSKQMRIENLADRAKAYGMPSEIVDGNDATAVFEASRRAVDLARSGGGPTFIEAKTFRMKGHAAHDNQSYVEKAMLEEWRGRDPIARLEKEILDQEVAASSEVAEVKTRAEALLDEDLAWAESQPECEPEGALGGVFAGDEAKAVGTQAIER